MCHDNARGDMDTPRANTLSVETVHFPCKLRGRIISCIARLGASQRWGGSGTLGDARGRSGTLGDARGRSGTLGDARGRWDRSDRGAYDGHECVFNGLCNGYVTVLAKKCIRGNRTGAVPGACQQVPAHSLGAPASPVSHEARNRAKTPIFAVKYAKTWRF